MQGFKVKLKSCSKETETEGSGVIRGSEETGGSEETEGSEGSGGDIRVRVDRRVK